MKKRCIFCGSAFAFQFCPQGGSNPATLAEAATWVERAGYDELNLNAGCPSCRVVTKGGLIGFRFWLASRPL